jgi:hypothetical protein
VKLVSKTTRDHMWGALPVAAADASHPLDLTGFDASVRAEITARLVSSRFDAWSRAAARVGYCARPIRLRGHSTTVDAQTGEVLSSFATDDEELGVLHVRCGNRRASDCPSCSRVYAADTFHLIRTGVTGGKGVPEHVSDNPLVFATLTAPSFGLVHGTRNGRKCRPFIPKGQPGVCEHGRPTVCHAVHGDGDEQLGQPLCGDCYDYLGHVVWQWWAPELWRRFTIAARRALAKCLGVPESRLKDYATVQYAKVAEHQLRGVIHFHALIRLDGPTTDDGCARAPAGLTAALLARVVEQAVATVSFDAPPLHEDDLVRRLRFGTQVDVRAVQTRNRVDDPDRELVPEQVAGYLAKYATKSASDSVDGGNAHLRRLRAVLAETADRIHSEAKADGIPLRQHPYALLGSGGTCSASAGPSRPSPAAIR